MKIIATTRRGYPSAWSATANKTPAGLSADACSLRGVTYLHGLFFDPQRFLRLWQKVLEAMHCDPACDKGQRGTEYPLTKTWPSYLSAKCVFTLPQGLIRAAFPAFGHGLSSSQPRLTPNEQWSVLGAYGNPFMTFPALPRLGAGRFLAYIDSSPAVCCGI